MAAKVEAPRRSLREWKRRVRSWPWLRLSNAIASALFAWAAYLQHHHSDPVAWIAVYALATAACVSVVADQESWLMPAAVSAAAGLWLLGIVVEQLAGGGAGDPLRSASRVEPAIDLTRQPLGLALVTIWLGFVTVRARRRQRAAASRDSEY